MGETMSDSLAHDLLWGAGAIAEELFGRNSEKTRRKTYYLHEAGKLPTWKNAGEIISRRSLLRQHFQAPQRITAASADAT
jgi:hypothetical protein